MKLPNRTGMMLLFAVCGIVIISFPSQEVIAEESGEVASQEKTSRQAILNSSRWAKAKRQFDEWLSVQTAYSKAELEDLQSELRSRIAGMSAQELHSFLEEMETKIAVLMSPATKDAQRWVSMYTEKAQQKIRKKYGVEDPMRLPAADIEAVLRQFAAERQSKMASSAAFDSARSSQAQAAKTYHQSQARAARSSPTPRASSRSPYAPRNTQRRPQTYSAPYHKMNYSVGPWGGVWVSPGRR